MKNPEKRREMLENGSFRDYTAKRKGLVISGLLQANDYLNEDTGEVGYLNATYFEMSEDDFAECENMRKCKKAQREKIEAHMRFLLEKARLGDIALYFTTFTFSDDTLNNTKKETRKVVIRRLLTSSYDYILNVDYGKENEREHYHAIVALRREEAKEQEHDDGAGHLQLTSLDSYALGYYSAEKVRIDGKATAEKLSRYITKLTQHSIKVAQSYVSTKKGTDYQEFKKAKERLKRVAHYVDHPQKDEIMAKSREIMERRQSDLVDQCYDFEWF